ncbi:hypothetical protein EV426DRAFT_9061 [Tirmania nivea]|nr:hypothetical protein EV426DRAFT_9061 [Tirmania nivea]
MSFHRDPALLRAKEVYAVLRECAGNCTVLVNACASGQWTKMAAQLLPGSLDHGITLCTRETEGEEIYSHHLSGSGEFCGGFYINGVAGRLYEEVGLHFPRPHIVNREVIEHFPPHNIGSHDAIDINRIKTTPLAASNNEVIEDMGGLCFPNSTPTTWPPTNQNHPATIFLGVPANQPIPVRFTSVIPPDPCNNFDARSVTGSFASLIQRYSELRLQDPCASSEVFLTASRYKYHCQKLNFLERLELRKHINRRMKLYSKALTFLDRHDLRRFCPAGDRST